LYAAPNRIAIVVTAERLSDNQRTPRLPGLHREGPEMYIMTIEMTIKTGSR